MAKYLFKVKNEDSLIRSMEAILMSLLLSLTSYLPNRTFNVILCRLVDQNVSPGGTTDHIGNAKAVFLVTFTCIGNNCSETGLFNLDL